MHWRDNCFDRAREIFHAQSCELPWAERPLFHMKRRQRREMEGNGRKRKGIPPASSVSLSSAFLEDGQSGSGKRTCAPGGGSPGDGLRERRWAGVRVAVGGGHAGRAAHRVAAYASPGGGLPVSSPISPASLAASRFNSAISVSICSVCLAARVSSISGFLEII